AVAADGGRACQDAGQQKREKNFRAGTGTATATRVWDMDMDMGDEPGPICSRNSSANTSSPCSARPLPLSAAAERVQQAGAKARASAESWGPRRGAPGGAGACY